MLCEVFKVLFFLIMKNDTLSTYIISIHLR